VTWFHFEEEFLIRGGGGGGEKGLSACVLQTRGKGGLGGRRKGIVRGAGKFAVLRRSLSTEGGTAGKGSGKDDLQNRTTRGGPIWGENKAGFSYSRACERMGVLGPA